MKLGDCTCAETGMHLCERHGIRDREQEAQTRKFNLGARKKPLARKSDKQKLIDSKLEGIREAFIFLTSRTPEGLHCWNCGRKCRADELDLHHLRPRGSGGEHSARNCEIWCRFPCHADRHGQPEWTRSEEAFETKFADGASHPDEDPAREHANAHLDPLDDALGQGRR